MGQEFHVVRCFSCQTFQVQQVKKVNRWSCKLCGEKQSLLQEFGRGSGADCRRHVQKLNAMRGTMIEKQEHHTWAQVEADGEDEPEEQVTQTEVSSWSKYLDTPEGVELKEDEEENVLMDRQQLHGNNRIDRKRKRRDMWTDVRQQDRRTPEQLNCFSLMIPVRPSDTTSHHSLNRTSPPSLNRTSPPSLKHTSPPSLNRTSPPSLRHTSHPSLTRISHLSLNRNSFIKRSITPSLSTGLVSRWAPFLSHDCQKYGVGEGPPINGWGQPVDGASSLSRPHHLLHVSSMFQSGDEFIFDDDYLPAERK